MKVKRVHSMVTAAALLASCGLVARSLPVQAANVTVAGGVPGVVMLGPDKSAAAGYGTATPIKHLVVIFQENVSFDHYFGTYPNAANLTGETPFTALANSPSINGLSGPLLTNNPNLYNPARLTPKQALTCDQDHNYTDEQKAYDNGLVDKFVQSVSGKSSNSAQYCPPGVVMDYFDGNTVTALWNYAQHYAMNDNSFDTNYGPSTPGALTSATRRAGGRRSSPRIGSVSMRCRRA